MGHRILNCSRPRRRPRLLRSAVTALVLAGMIVGSLQGVDSAGPLAAAVARADGNAVPEARASASRTHGPSPLTVMFDASESTDPDGSIVSYGWDFDGDGTWDQTAPGPRISHTYEAAGLYRPVLRVTDDAGATDDLQIARLIANTRPSAAFTASPETGIAPQKTTFDATSSTDVDGSITSWSWDFGDGTTGTGSTVTHTYTEPGTYTVAVLVEDDLGGRNRVARTVGIAANQSPAAALSFDPVSGDQPLTVTFDGSTSSDPDGTVTEWNWDFGDYCSCRGSCRAGFVPGEIGGDA